MDWQTEERGGRVLNASLGRRTLLRSGVLGGTGLLAAALIGCGDDEEEEPAGDGAGAATATEAGDGGDDSAASTWGRLIEDPALPYPINFPEPAKEPKPGGTLRVAVTWDTSTMDPVKSAAGGTITVPNTSYNRLIGFLAGPDFDPVNLVLEPELAESWESSPDGLTHTFKIRGDVQWQNVAPLDGRQFVAEDAKYAYERYASDGVHQALWEGLDSIEAVDDTTLKLTLERPLVDFIIKLGGRYQTIFPRELVESGEIESKVVGTGPMIMQEAVQSSHVRFLKNPDYFETNVLLDGMEYRIVPDLATRIAQFRAGQIEYGYALTSKQADVEELLKSNPDIQVTNAGGTAGGYGFAMNLQNPKFQDERVRRAISLAHDHEQFLAILHEGLGWVLPLTPWAFLFDERPAVEDLGNWVRYAPDEAKQLLQAAGAEDLEINAIYYTYAGYDAQRPELLVPMLRDAGIRLNVTKADYTEFNSQWVGRQLPEATTSGWPAAGFDADNYFYNQVHSESPGNRWQLSDPEIDEWALAQQTELDPAARRELHLKIWNKDLDMMYRIPQAGGVAFEVQQPWLRGWRGQGAGFGVGSYYYDWGDQVHRVWLDR